MMRAWATVFCVLFLVANIYLLHRRPETNVAFSPFPSASPSPGSGSSFWAAPSTSPASYDGAGDSSPSPSATMLPSSSPSPQNKKGIGKEHRRRYTEVDCREHGSFCIYSNVCYDGEKVVMLVEDGEIADRLHSSPRPSPHTYGSTRKWFDVEALTYDDVDALLPRNQRFEVRTMPASLLFGDDYEAVRLPLQVNENEAIPYKNLTEGKIEYIWLDGSVYLQSADTEGNSCKNLWHWSLGTIPLWTDQYINKTLNDMRRHSLVYDANGNEVRKTEKLVDDDLLLPPMDYVLNLCDGDPFAWGAGLLQAIVPTETKIIQQNYLKADLVEGGPPYVGIQPAVEKKANLGLAPNRRLLCSDKAVVHTNQYTLFNSMAEWRGFRKTVLERVGLNEMASRTDAPPKVVFKATGRTATNVQELLEVCRKYTTCEMTSEWDHGTSFQTQVREVATAGILVGSHGAGITNAMFLPPYGALIELFGYKWWPDMYRRMANEMGIAYYTVTNLDRPVNALADDDPCINVTALQFPNDRCTHKVKYEPFSIPVEAFEVTLVNALQQIGVNALPSGKIRPSPSPILS